MVRELADGLLTVSSCGYPHPFRSDVVSLIILQSDRLGS